MVPRIKSAYLKYICGYYYFSVISVLFQCHFSEPMHLNRCRLRA